MQREYDVLFVFSSGNYEYAYEHNAKDVLEEYPEYFYIEEKSRVIDPAASSLSLTVGGMAISSTPFSASDDRIDFLQISLENQISSMTRVGPGIQKAIKLEFVAYSGDMVFNTNTQRISKNVGNGILSFSNKLTEGLFCQDIGTSLAAPYVSHIAALVLAHYPESSNNLLRAILASAAYIPDEIISQVKKLKDTSNNKDKYQDAFKQNSKGQYTANIAKMLHYLAGYGYPREEDALDSFEQRVVLLADMRDEEAIEVDKNHIFEIPIPREFELARGKKRITVSLAYNPDVRKTRMDYLGKTMSFELIRGKDLEEVYRVYVSQAGLS